MSKTVKARKKSLKTYIISLILALLGYLGYTEVGSIKPAVDSFADYIADIIIKRPHVFGNVYSVADGDTLVVLDDKGDQIKVRLYGIDAPELSQAFGKESKWALSNLVSGKNVDLEVIDQDKYGRIVAVVKVEGVNVNEYMLENGYAWYYGQYCKKHFCSNWQSLQSVAKADKAGLWKAKVPKAPWEYRQGNGR